MRYLKDKLYAITLTLFTFVILLLIFFAFKVDKDVILATIFVLIILFIILFLIDYFRKRKFYTNLLANIESLDKSYLVLETLTKPEFYEGELLFQALYEINKSMSENINKIEEQWHDFKDYIEMWIHEVKIPLSALILISNNHKDKFDKKIKVQLKRLEDYVDQVLYYARSENAEKDYLIKEISLSKVIKNVGLKNMDDLLENKIDYIVDNTITNVKVLTDSKWLEFILGQIINNSIKYKKDIEDSYIKIQVCDEKNKTTLIIEDNGIGIKESDLKQVFDKTFTGENGRIKGKSTGMGLFISKNMCEKLGHRIDIKSEENNYTRVYITFAKNNYYEVIK
ncbi:MAG: sensor histidine kinase [Clostridium sp.]|nr:sensor histidine kinase [Clostridium sp.]MCM1444075.1 sensor histidine kinase [Candidatus Amulumruptor caecigallinarius]